MTCSNQTVCTLPAFWAPCEADVKINVIFGFGIPKNIEIDIRRVPIKQFAFYPHFGPQFQPQYGADVKINVRFEFGTSKNIEIDIRRVPIRGHSSHVRLGG